MTADTSWYNLVLRSIKSGRFCIILKLDRQGNPGWPIVSSYGYLKEHKLNRIIRIAKRSHYDKKF